jgi:heat shock protein HslJ
MAKNAIVIALALAMAGCAGISRPADLAESASASIRDMSELAGRWQGVVSETAGSLVSGSSPVDLTIAPDGTWRGTIARAPASGEARLRGRRLILDGTAATPNGPSRPVHLDLTGDSTRRWGETVATFSGHEDRATVALDRVQA